MGDRVTCYLTVPTACQKAAEGVLKKHDHIFEDYDQDDPANTVSFELLEVNYARFEDEEDDLRELGIPFTFEWCDGGSFSSGKTHARFVDGKQLYQTYYDDAADGVPIDRVGTWLESLDIPQIQKEFEQYKEDHSYPDFNEDYEIQFKRYQLNKVVKP